MVNNFASDSFIEFPIPFGRLRHSWKIHFFEDVLPIEKGTFLQPAMSVFPWG